MTNSLQWSVPSEKLFRGCVVDAQASGDDVAALGAIFPELWREAEAVFRHLCDPSAKKAIEAEIWPDTGRIILVLKDRREFARLVLTCPSLERAYFSLPKQPEQFAAKYANLSDTVRAMLSDSLGGSAFVKNESHGNRPYIVVRDCDDNSTTVPLPLLKQSGGPTTFV